jgi:RNA polymerase sigma-70 factor (ECF subfamily)
MSTESSMNCSASLAIASADDRRRAWQSALNLLVRIAQQARIQRLVLHGRVHLEAPRETDEPDQYVGGPGPGPFRLEEREKLSREHHVFFRHAGSDRTSGSYRGGDRVFRRCASWRIDVPRRMSESAESMSAADAELVRDSALGNRDALTELYDRHSPRMLAVATKILGSRREAEDVLHDVFVEAWAHAGDYDPARGSVKTWLLLRLRSRCLDVLRSAEHRKTEALPEEGGSAKGPPEANRSADAWGVGSWEDSLPEPQREVLTLIYFEGLSMSEIAARISLPIGTVKSRAARGLADLKARTSGAGVP